MAFRSSDLVTLTEQFGCVPGIVDPDFRGDKTGDTLVTGANRDQSFQEMFSDLAGSC
jgi:hypothetical protein